MAGKANFSWIRTRSRRASFWLPAWFSRRSASRASATLIWVASLGSLPMAIGAVVKG